MRILIFGGSGFLGKNLSKYLSKKKHKVTIFDKKKNSINLKKIKFIKGDILNLRQVIKASKNQDIIFNLAGISDIGDSIKNPILTTKINILGSVNTLEAAVKNKVKRYVFASSIYVLSSQGGFYKTSKKSVESFIEEYNKRDNLNYTILRYGSVYGPDSDERNGIKKIISSCLKDKSILYGGTSKAERRFLHVKDAVKASEKILNNKFINTRVLITGSKKIKIKDLILQIKKILKINKKILFKRKPMLGHYDKNPFNDKPKKQLIYYVKPSVSLNKGINEIISILN